MPHSQQNNWQTKFNTFFYWDSRYKHLSQLHAIFFGLFILTAGLFYFVLNSTPQYDACLLTLSMFGMAISLPLSIVLRLFLSRAKSRKNDLARQFFFAGLRIDKTLLVTNVAHSEIVAAYVPEQQ